MRTNKIGMAILAAALVLLTTGCGAGNTPAGGDASVTSNTPVMSDPVSDDTAEKAAFVATVAGEWISFSGSNTDTYVSQVTVNEDYTLDLGDGIAYTWAFSTSGGQTEIAVADLNAQLFYVSVFDEDQQLAARLTFYWQEDDLYKMNFEWNLGGYFSYADSFGKAADFEMIEITKANFYDYFEIIDVCTPSKDKFGDFRGLIEYDRYFLLKDAYLERVTRWLGVPVELKYSFTLDYYGLSCNENTDEYRLLGAQSSDDWRYTLTTSFTYSGCQVIGNSCCKVYEWPLESGEWVIQDYPVNIEIEGVLGYLFLKRNT